MINGADNQKMTRRMFASLLISLPQMRAENRKHESTGAWRAAWALRRNLEEMGLYDDMPENWNEVTRAIAGGCTNFTTGVSRVEVRKHEPALMLYRVLPIKAPPNENGWFERWDKRDTIVQR